EESSNAFRDAAQRISRLGEGVLDERHRLDGLILERLEEDFAPGDFSELPDGPDLTGELAQGAGPRDLERPEIRHHLIVVHVAVAPRGPAPGVAWALGERGGKAARDTSVGGCFVAGRSRRDHGEHHAREHKDQRAMSWHVVTSIV